MRSVFVGNDSYGNPVFDTTRSEIGDLLYRLKYRGDTKVVGLIATAAVKYLRRWKPNVDLVVPVPPNKARSIQPVMLIGKEIAKRLGIPFAPDAVRKTKSLPQLKDVHEYDVRAELLEGAYKVARTKVEGRCVLLFDDLYRSGATMNAVADAVAAHGRAAAVFALVVTRTRSNV